MDFTLNDFIQWVLGMVCGYGLWIAYIKYDLWKLDKKEKALDKLIRGDSGEIHTGNKGTK